MADEAGRRTLLPLTTRPLPATAFAAAVLPLHCRLQFRANGGQQEHEPRANGQQGEVDNGEDQRAGDGFAGTESAESSLEPRTFALSEQNIFLHQNAVTYHVTEECYRVER